MLMSDKTALTASCRDSDIPPSSRVGSLIFTPVELLGPLGLSEVGGGAAGGNFGRVTL